MRSRWLLSVVACLLSSGIALTQPTKKPPLSSTSDSRTVVPTDLKAPANKLPERASILGFAVTDSSRTQLTSPLARTLTQPDKSDRSYPIEQGNKHAAVEPAIPRDSALLRVQPGDKVNKIADANSIERNFNPANIGRAALPVGLVVPSDRHVPGDR